MRSCLNGLKKSVSRSGADMLIMSSVPDIRYATGVGISPSLLLVTPAGRPSLVVHSMNAGLASGLDTGSNLEIVSGKTLARSVVSVCSDAGARNIAVDTRCMSARLFLEISRSLSGRKFITEMGKGHPGSYIPHRRIIKTKEEIDILRQAAQQTLSVWNDLEKELGPGIRECEVAALTEKLICERGVASSFPPIAASGENTAYPHAVPGSCCFAKDGHLMVDFGLKYRGYCSDLTRIFYNGRINRTVRWMTDLVRDALEISFNTIRPGRSISGLAKRINTFFKKRGAEEYIRHSLGHGIGIEVHERPSLTGGNRKRFKPGMVFTVEPGLYKEGCGGVRIEEMVLVTGKGCEVLTR